MIEQNNLKRNQITLMKYASKAYINETVNEIRTYIFNTKFTSNYMKYAYDYKNTEKEDHSSLINDDWQFCIFICKFIEPNEPLSNIVLILEQFLYKHRYHKKFDNDSSYLKSNPINWIW